MSPHLKKASILTLLPHTYAWLMLSGIDAVKASNFGFIFDSKFLKVLQNHRIILMGEAQAEREDSYKGSEERLQVGWQVVTFTTGFAATCIVLTAASVACSEQQCRPEPGCQAGK